MLLEQIVRAQQGSSEDMEALAEKFGPLLKKYSRKLFWEDALSDLTVAFLELIQTFPVDRLRSREDGVIVEDAKNNKKYAGLRLTFTRRIALSLPVRGSTRPRNLKIVTNFVSNLAMRRVCPPLPGRNAASCLTSAYWVMQQVLQLHILLRLDK